MSEDLTAKRGKKRFILEIDAEILPALLRAFAPSCLCVERANVETVGGRELQGEFGPSPQSLGDGEACLKLQPLPLGQALREFLAKARRRKGTKKRAVSRPKNLR